MTQGFTQGLHRLASSGLQSNPCFRGFTLEAGWSGQKDVGYWQGTTTPSRTHLAKASLPEHTHEARTSRVV